MIKKVHSPYLPPNGKTIYSGPRFEVQRVQMTGNQGQLIARDMVVHPGAVAILPLIDENHVVMIQNERFAVGQTLLELPAGTLEATESPLDTAKRELLEETGYVCTQIDFFMQFFTSPGFCNEVIFSYVAQNLTLIGQQLEENEKITTLVMSWSEIKTEIKKGSIQDGKTLLTLLCYLQKNSL